MRGWRSVSHTPPTRRNARRRNTRQRRKPRTEVVEAIVEPLAFGRHVTRELDEDPVAPVGRRRHPALLNHEMIALQLAHVVPVERVFAFDLQHTVRLHEQMLRIRSCVDDDAHPNNGVDGQLCADIAAAGGVTGARDVIDTNGVDLPRGRHMHTHAVCAQRGVASVGQVNQS